MASLEYLWIPEDGRKVIESGKLHVGDGWMADLTSKTDSYCILPRSLTWPLKIYYPFGRVTFCSGGMLIFAGVFGTNYVMQVGTSMILQQCRARHGLILVTSMITSLQSPFQDASIHQKAISSLKPWKKTPGCLGYIYIYIYISGLLQSTLPFVGGSMVLLILGIPHLIVVWMVFLGFAFAFPCFSCFGKSYILISFN